MVRPAQVPSFKPLCHAGADYVGHHPHANDIVTRLQQLPIMDREEFIRKAYIPTNRHSRAELIEDYEIVHSLEGGPEIVKDHLNAFLEKHATPIDYCGYSFFATMMPSHSCAHTALEILQSPMDSLSPLHLEYETNGFPAGLYTASEVANEHQGVKVVFGSRASIGLYIGDEEKYKVISSEKALVKFLRRKLSSGS